MKRNDSRTPKNHISRLDEDLDLPILDAQHTEMQLTEINLKHFFIREYVDDPSYLLRISLNLDGSFTVTRFHREGGMVSVPGNTTILEVRNMMRGN